MAINTKVNSVKEGRSLRAMRKLTAILCCSTVLLLHGAQANAKDSSDMMLDMVDKLLSHSENFNNMEESLSGVDHDVAAELEVTAMSAADHINFFSDLLDLRSVMVNRLDKVEVQRTLKTHKASLAKQCPLFSKHITQQMAFAHSPAVVSEAEHLRDDVASACERVRSLK